MTSNEIAQMVRSEPYHTNLNRNVIADFIDQQADKIAELEKQLDTRTRELIGASFYEHDYKTMMANNKPVAWMNKETGVVCKEIYATKIPDDLIPLYTHPVKELTDEEIMELSYLTSDNDPIDFARAILRKAQEK